MRSRARSSRASTARSTCTSPSCAPSSRRTPKSRATSAPCAESATCWHANEARFSTGAPRAAAAQAHLAAPVGGAAGGRVRQQLRVLYRLAERLHALGGHAAGAPFG